MAIKHIIFDLYGTLIDADPNKLNVKRSILMRFGENRWMTENTPESDFFEEFGEQEGINAQELTECYKQMEASTAFFDGAVELLGELAQTYHIHIISNCGKSIEWFVEDNQEVFDLFTTTNFSYQIGTTKPDPFIFTQLLEKLNAEPEECVMIGDSHHDDIEPAKKLGMLAIPFDGRHIPVEELRNQLHTLIHE